ncbi:isoprenyl transferase [uncultured Paludibaculum sp.]|uniref:isoprenyl transferase n=1 Tax=uncultured Paludibaculum sp. TaxID=1765020 RepID=UPI002AAAE2E9|nr:isoprenyl transferase [uncultured Paludibaculum sp.]
MKDFLSMQALLQTLKPGSPEWVLARSLDPERLPAHIGVIMDGNGRWANSRRLPRAAGHKAGVEPVRMTVETCARMNVQSLTLYAFSVENWKRPRTEVETLWRLLCYYLKKEVAHLMQNNIRLRAIGRLDELSSEIRKELDSAATTTAGNSGLILNLAINYGGRSEIVDAVNQIVDEARRAGRLDQLKIDEDAISRNLYTAGQPEPDLLIRTSGEMRISNFLLWQIAYAELYVTETYWPDFNRTALLEALAAYQKRDRRFGGIRPAPARVCADDPALEAVSSPTR